jgi:hypothetical protein
LQDFALIFGIFLIFAQTGSAISQETQKRMMRMEFKKMFSEDRLSSFRKHTIGSEEC